MPQPPKQHTNLRAFWCVTSCYKYIIVSRISFLFLFFFSPPNWTLFSLFYMIIIFLELFHIFSISFAFCLFLDVSPSFLDHFPSWNSSVRRLWWGSVDNKFHFFFLIINLFVLVWKKPYCFCVWKVVSLEIEFSALWTLSLDFCYEISFCSCFFVVIMPFPPASHKTAVILMCCFIMIYLVVSFFLFTVFRICWVS